MFADNDDSGDFTNGDTLVRRHNALDDSLQVIGNRAHIAYRPTGMAPGSNTTIRFCDGRGPDARRALVLSNTGRVRLARPPQSTIQAC